MKLTDLAEICKTRIVMLKLVEPVFDIAKLLQIQQRVCLPEERAIQGNVERNYGGWALQRHPNSTAADSFYPGSHRLKYGVEYPDSQNCTTPTELFKHFKPDFFDVMDANKIRPYYRTRITSIANHGRNSWHTDSLRNQLGHWRLHLALQTHPDAMFMWRNELKCKVTYRTNIPADGHMYLIRADVPHKIKSGKTDVARIHILTDITTEYLSQLDLGVESAFEIGTE